MGSLCYDFHVSFLSHISIRARFFFFAVDIFLKVCYYNLDEEELGFMHKRD